MRVIETNGTDVGDDGLQAICVSCLEPFDERGGILFDPRPGRGKTGLCADCTNEVVETSGGEVELVDEDKED